MAWTLDTGSFYPAHLVVGNLYCHVWRGEQQVGRHVECLVCGITNNTRNRNGDARFVRAHRRCGFDRQAEKPCKIRADDERGRRQRRLASPLSLAERGPSPREE